MQDNGFGRITPHNFKQEHDRFLTEVLVGLHKPQKELPPKYCYDVRGSHLFERICDLDEYYIPRIEASIMRDNIREMSDLISPHAILIEYGSGNCEKGIFLLEHMNNPAVYMPIDISQEQLSHAASRVAAKYPELQVIPVFTDYTYSFELPIPRNTDNRLIVYFPGSTISNFNPPLAKLFLNNIANLCGPNGALFIGVDLKKDPAVLHTAYNDSKGRSAAFKLNLLERINRELGSDFQPEEFQHYAFYNPQEDRIEMHLVSQRNQEVHINGETISFTRGESIWTESSYKYNLDEFEKLAKSAGFRVEHTWVDELQWFSVQYLVAI